MSLQSIISDQAVVRAQTYNDVINILEEADQNPENSNQVWLVYLEKGRSKLDFQLNSDNIGTWNREHTWPRSRGGFNSIEADEAFNGKDIFWLTDPDSIRHANSDAHAIRAVDGPENSTRGNQFYGEYNGPIGTKGGFKGDVARGVFYLAIRYNGLELERGYPEGQAGKFGDLDTLLAWHRRDPPDDYEMNRNNVVYTWQFNRNPFIDNPSMVEYIWGNKKGQIWQNPTMVDHTISSAYEIFPNPTNGTLNITGINEAVTIQVSNIHGQLIDVIQTNENLVGRELNVAAGLYVVKITSDSDTDVRIIMVE
jgi:endonuclease I